VTKLSDLQQTSAYSTDTNKPGTQQVGWTRELWLWCTVSVLMLLLGTLQASTPLQYTTLLYTSVVGSFAPPRGVLVVGCAGYQEEFIAPLSKTVNTPLPCTKLRRPARAGGQGALRFLPCLLRAQSEVRFVLYSICPMPHQSYAHLTA